MHDKGKDEDKDDVATGASFVLALVLRPGGKTVGMTGIRYKGVST